MAAEDLTDPKQLQVRLSALAMVTAANDTANDCSLLELAEDACSRMVLLIENDSAHTANEQKYRGFYLVVQDIINQFDSSPCWPR
ncbi:hypothetical protein PM082_014013 [Marasmius tenuissimus]|nr:hypothetical protein PM082_014013 [Marasmius tenuissimus]